MYFKIHIKFRENNRYFLQLKKNICATKIPLPVSSYSITVMVFSQEAIDYIAHLSELYVVQWSERE